VSLPYGLILSTLARIAGAGLLLFYVWPIVALPQAEGLAPVDRAVHNASRMLVIAIAIGYLLTATHLYSWPLLVICLYLLRYSRPRRPVGRFELPRNARIAAALLEDLDELAEMPRRLAVAAWAHVGARISGWRRPDAYTVASGAILLGVLAVAAWLRFFSNFAHAALPYSDAYVVVYWVKSIENQVLFPNGIYPEGFHLTIAELSTLLFAHALPFVKFFGPTVGLLMAASTAFAAWRLTGRISAGIAALVVYGTLTALLPYTIGRQTATDSQEFGNSMVLAVGVFAYLAWTNPKERAYAVTAVALMAAIALVHTLALLNAVACFLAGTLAAWAVRGVRGALLRYFVLALAVAAALAVTPIAVAYGLFHIPLNSSSVSFAVATQVGPPPPVPPIEVLALLAPLALSGLRLLRRRGPDEVGAPLVVFLMVAAAAFLQEAPRFGIHSTVLGTRWQEFLALAEAAALGVGVAFLEELLEWFIGRRAARWAVLAAIIPAMALGWYRFPLRAPTVYTVDSDAFVAAYEKIIYSNQNDSWLGVSQASAFSIVYGKGYNLTPQSWVQDVPTDTKGPWPRYKGRPVTEPLIFFFVFSHIHTQDIAQIERATIATERQGNAEIRAWLAAWSRVPGHVRPQVYFTGPGLTVYEIRHPGRGGQ